MPIIKNKWYRINGIIVSEGVLSFVYPDKFDDDCFVGRNPMRCRSLPIYITQVDLEIDNINGSGKKAYPYIAGIVQGYSSTVYVASGNSYMFQKF